MNIEIKTLENKIDKLEKRIEKLDKAEEFVADWVSSTYTSGGINPFIILDGIFAILVGGPIFISQRICEIKKIKLEKNISKLTFIVPQENTKEFSGPVLKKTRKTDKK